MLALIKNYRLFILLFLALLLRLVLMFVDFSFDVNNHIVWAKDLHAFGFTSFFDKPSTEVYSTLYPNYPPVTLFLFYLAYPLSKIIFDVAWWLNTHISLFPSFIFPFFERRTFIAGILKIPSILFDFVFVWILILLAKKLNPKKNPTTDIVSLTLFNPVFFYNSAFWGQIDTIPIVLLLASYYVMLYTQTAILAGILFTLGLLIKPTIIIFTPIFLFFLLKRYGLSNTIKSTLASTLLFMLSFIFFLAKGDTFWGAFAIYYKKILAAQSLSYATNGAFNIWAILTQFVGTKTTEPFLLNVSYEMWGYVLTGLCFVAIMYKCSKIKDMPTALYTTSFLTALATCLFLTKMHERYFILPLPFLLLLSIKETRYRIWFYSFSFFTFLNIYHSWAVPFIRPLFAIVDNPLGYSSIALFFLISFFYLLKKV